MTKTITYPPPISDVTCTNRPISLNTFLFSIFRPKYFRIFLIIQAQYQYLLVGKLFFIFDPIHHSRSSLVLGEVIN